MAEKHVHKVYGSFPPWGKSVEFPAGGGASGGGGNYVYYSGTERDFAEGVAMASIIKANLDGDIVFMPSGVFWTPDANTENIIGAGFDTSMKMTSRDDSSELITVGDVIAEPSKEWTQITEEEFYKIPTQFTVLTSEDVVYEFIEGQSWRDWINSSANQGNIYIGEFAGKECVRVIDSGGNDFQLYVGSTSQLTHPDDTLVAGEVYFVWV